MLRAQAEWALTDVPLIAQPNSESKQSPIVFVLKRTKIMLKYQIS